MVVIPFVPRREFHARAPADISARSSAGRRAAKRVINSAVSDALRATDVAKIADHHSAGMLSRRRHFDTMDDVTPISAPNAVGVGHISITAAKDFGFDIESDLGQIGLSGKAYMAHDLSAMRGDNAAAMPDRMSETEEKLAFIRRVKRARMARFETQRPICTILGIEQGVYKHYETRSPLPYRFIPKFVAATGIDYEWLLTGEGKGPAETEYPKEVPAKTTRRQRQKAA